MPHPELDGVSDEAAAEPRRWYCGTLAVELGHIPDPKRRAWLYERMEAEPETVDHDAVLDQLIRAATFEELLQSRYIGNKRFSIEGIEALIPLLTEMLHEAGERRALMAVLAMAHRGRLNVMGNVVGRDPVELFAGFEDVDPRSIMGAGDVKYHLGATGVFTARSGDEVKIHLVSNPSHLEAVGPVAIGRVRAKQARIGDDDGRGVFPILMHGDAALAGQGIAAETLNLSGIDGFSVGGTVHVVVNNLIGFTTEPQRPAQRAVRLRHLQAAADPDPARQRRGPRRRGARRPAGDRLPLRVRQRRGRRPDRLPPPRPQRGRRSDDHPAAALRQDQEAAARCGRSTPATRASRRRTPKRGRRRSARSWARPRSSAEKLAEIPTLRTLPPYWADFAGGPWRPELEVDTGLAAGELGELAARLTAVPDGFEIHPKVAKLLEQRAAMGRGEAPVDFGMAELLAYASLVRAGTPVRISGQDTRRGTFTHRHAVWVDVENADEHCPLDAIAPDQARFEIYDTMLSEAAVLGFEYGYSRDTPEALVAWEAQFGDFANGAQVIFDQFVTAGEDKWKLLSGLVVLLPHGYEGQGPEHSSARMERFLQLAAEDAIQIAQPSTACQHFHLLRRQALRRWRKPLIVFTPKSMLRHKAAASPLAELARPRFWNVMPERNLETARRVLICTGKIGHELRAERARRGDDSIAILSLEQLYPFPADELLAELDRFRDARDLVWVQEEPANMGALSFVLPRLEQLARGRHVRSIKRSPSASPATGSPKAHQMEQKTLLELALS